MKEREYQICTNCVMDTSDSLIQFDEKGICDHCNNYYNNILPNWHPGDRSKAELQRIADKIKREGKGKAFDCIIGISGGVDSSYLTYYAVEKLGLNPYVLLVDTGWNSDVANENIKKIVNGLGVKLHTIVVDWDEMKDLQLAFFKAQIASIDIQDHAIFAALYNTAVKKGIKYVLTGGNYATECIREPLEWAGMNDLTMLKDIHKRFGTRPLKNFPTCGMFKYKLYYRYVKGMKVVQPLNMIPYTKELAIAELSKKFGWKRYENKHFESIFTRFFEGYWLIKKFGYDKRRAHFSSLIVTGQMKRNQALELLKKPPYEEDLALKDMEYIANRLDITKEEFLEIMQGKNRSMEDAIRCFRNNYSLIKGAVKIAKWLGVEKRNLR